MKIFYGILFLFLVLNVQADTTAKSKFTLADDGKKIYKSIMPKIKVYYPEKEAEKVAAKAKLQTQEKSAKKQFVSSDKIKKTDFKKEDVSTQENPTTFFENLNKEEAKTINME